MPGKATLLRATDPADGGSCDIIAVCPQPSMPAQLTQSRSSTHIRHNGYATSSHSYVPLWVNVARDGLLERRVPRG